MNRTEVKSHVNSIAIAASMKFRYQYQQNRNNGDVDDDIATCQRKCLRIERKILKLKLHQTQLKFQKKMNALKVSRIKLREAKMCADIEIVKQKALAELEVTAKRIELGL